MMHSFQTLIHRVRGPFPSAGTWLRACTIALARALAAPGGHAEAQGSGDAKSAATPDQRTDRALIWAANRGAVQAVRQLRAAGADPKAKPMPVGPRGKPRKCWATRTCFGPWSWRTQT